MPSESPLIRSDEENGADKRETAGEEEVYEVLGDHSRREEEQ